MSSVKMETSRLILRKPVPSDAGFYFNLMNSDGYYRFIGDRNIGSVDDALNYLENRVFPTFQEHGYGMYTVLLKSTQEAIGVCGLVCRDSLPGPDLGFAFLSGFNGKGYAYESAQEVLNYAQSQLKMHVLLAITDLNNKRSLNLLYKLGFIKDDVDMKDGDLIRLSLHL